MTKNTWLNYLSTKLIRSATTQDGKEFKSISIPYEESANGFATLTVANGQIFAAKNKSGVENPAFQNVLLGKPEATRKVSICTKMKTDTEKGEYATIELTNAQIGELYQASRQAYKAAAVATEADAE